MLLHYSNIVTLLRIKHRGRNLLVNDVDEFKAKFGDPGTEKQNWQRWPKQRTSRPTPVAPSYCGYW